jgi:hypothetical protein
VDETVDSGTLDLIFSEARQVPESQMRTAEALSGVRVPPPLLAQ